ncbi:hypothetical protein H6G33_36155 [Calothrix sp. FACHB-1219]|uniref:hypothetical protein n=1 Tax=unclassified Calothrix TaxID=2619626 RepID=UPI0016859700|nr:MULTISPECIES: hypothetical protein [unclassified Calothrix]MBD2202389.1 hypothetical protein [Calothrix sp. FACHB-168]MBD2222365.1 hypothetical protein [Calothrix sp. FACHB-1219]
MIYESGFWKDDLLKQAKFLRSKMTQKRWTENSFARLEQNVMLGFYSIRKLIEAKKLSDSVVNKCIDVNAYTWKGQPVTKMNWGDIDKLYDLDAAQPTTNKLVFFCNQFIHSYIFVTSFDENNCLNGLFISSDKKRHETLYFIEMRHIIDLFEQVGNDSPSSASFIFDEKLGDYRVLNLTDNDPDFAAKIQAFNS